MRRKPKTKGKQMKYIKVTNKADQVNRLKLEKLGFSTKRDDTQTIGQFGSGIKFAPISAIRKGIDFIFAGNDSKGSYTLEYIIQDDEGVPSVFYKYQDYEKASSFTADAGTLSWESEFQIYREVVANAMDEAKMSETEWNISVVHTDEIVAVEGEFSVYLGATDEMIKIHENFDKYFSVNREPIFETSYGKIYKSYDGSLRVYCKGVLVYSSEMRVNRSGGPELMALYDYELNDVNLNEERTVSSEWEMNRLIISLLAKIDDKDMVNDVLDFAFNKSENFNEYYETTTIPSYLFSPVVNISETWKECFEDIYPKGILVNAKQFNFNMQETINSRGFKPVVIKHEGFETFFGVAQFPKLLDVLGNDFQYEYTFDITQSRKLVKAINIIEDVHPDFVGMRNDIGIFNAKAGEDESLASGITLVIRNSGQEDRKAILLERSHCEGSSIQSIVSTLIHEWDHFRTGISDGDSEGRSFRSLADERIGELVCRLWEELTGESIAK
jgi:hypothetical protein